MQLLVSYYEGRVMFACLVKLGFQVLAYRNYNTNESWRPR